MTSVTYTESLVFDVHCVHVKTAKRALAFALLFAVCATASILLDGFVDDKSKARVLVVLGNQVFEDGTPAPRLKARLDHALKISRGREIDMIIVTGATGHSGVNEAIAMANYLGKRSDVKIVQDPNGANTRLSAQNIAKMVDQNVPLQVVSQYFHVPRTRMAFLQEGFVSVQGGAPNYHEIRDIYSVPRDLVGLIAYALCLR